MPKRRTTSTSRRAGYSRKGRVASTPKRRRTTRVSNRNDDGGAAFAAAFGSVQPPEKSHRDPRVDELLRQQEAATAARLQALDESDADDGSDDDAEDGDDNDEDYMDEGEEDDDDDDARIVRERRNDLSDIASARALIDQLAQKPELDARRSRILEVRRAAQGHADSDTESEDDLIVCSSDDEVADDEDDGIAEYDSDEDDIPLAMLANTTTASRRKERVKRRKARKAALGPTLNQAGKPYVRGGVRKHLANPVSLQQMKEGVVHCRVHSRCVNEIMHWTNWMRIHQPQHFTEHGLAEHDKAVATIEGEGQRAYLKRRKTAYMKLINEAEEQALLEIDNITAKDVMTYIATQANQKSGDPLGEAGYSLKRSSIKHMVRAHNQIGWSHPVSEGIAKLWKGFTRCTSQRSAAKANRANGISSDESSEEDDDRDLMTEGKRPMSPELFKAVCAWLIGWGNLEGIYGAFFIALTWNLNCRGHNTGKIRFSHMSWDQFDCMHIQFRHTKTEQMGKAKRRKRAIYSNPIQFNIDIPFLLGMYLATYFNEEQNPGRKLFPGSQASNAQRVNDILQKVLKEHQTEVEAMGQGKIGDFGTHSLRKGVSTYLASLPGGPSPAALSVRGGWSMGTVKDIYFDHAQGGDEFCGRCACLLNMMDESFSMSALFFAEDADQQLIQDTINSTFPHFCKMEGMGRILRRCLASLVDRSKHVAEHLDPNHPIMSIPLYRDLTAVNALTPYLRYVKASSDDPNVISGCPPYIRQLAYIAKIKFLQESVVEDVVKRVMEETTAFFDKREIGGGNWTDERIQESMRSALNDRISEMEKRMQDNWNKLARAFAQYTGNCPEAEVALEKDMDFDLRTQLIGPKPTYELRSNGHGGMTRLPKDFQFPRCGTHDLWIQWNIPNKERKIPPLRDFNRSDIVCLDSVEKTENEKRGSKGKFKNNRQPGRKVYSDIKFLCNFIEDAAKAAGLDASDKSILNLQRMFDVAAPKLQPNGSAKAKAQNRWTTVCFNLRKRLREEKKAREDIEVVGEPAGDDGGAGEVGEV